KLIDGAAMTVSVDQTTSAQTGIAYLSGASVSTTALSIQIGSSRGNTELTFAAGTTQANIATAVNAVKEVTGVSGTVSGGVVKLNSVDFGTDSYVSVEILSGQQTGTGIHVNTDAAGTSSSSVKDYGVNIEATVNGTSATGSGKKLTIRTAMLDAEIDLSNTQAMSTSATTFNITGGGADFALGAKVDAIGLESIGLQNVTTTALGNATDGYLNTLKSGGDQALSGNNLYTAQNIVSDAIKDVASMRGRLGSFQKNTLEKTISSLEVTKENLYAAESAIRDTDFATETSRLTRSQILVQASTNVLAQANRSPQTVLSLLG
ncbi:MAG: flagellin, partial [Phycisphaerae bacterium]|nr:flagellin [Phycisphaerae bacterium]